MTNHGFKPIRELVVLLTVSLSLLGCTGPLEQQSRIVRIAPVCEEYKLGKRLEGKVYILLAETSTGQEQHRYAVSDSLARALKENGNGSNAVSLFSFKNKSDREGISSQNLQVLSFTDFANRINEKGLSCRLADTKDFYQKNGMFRKSDLEFLAREVEADYFVLPCLLDVRRWATGRFSICGVKLINTQVVSGVVSMEIWDVRKGHKVFGATSDVTVAGERITEEPISVEEAFERAWLGIIQELPKSDNPIQVMAATTPVQQAPKAYQPGYESVD